MVESALTSHGQEARSCPVCGALAGEPLHHRSFVLPDGHPLAQGYTVVTCAVCGAAYATPLPDQAAYDRFYRDDSKYADAATGTGSGAQEWDDQRLEQTARELASLTRDPRAHIVDIGCGAGGLLRWLAKLGHSNLTGVDPAPACAEATAAIPGVRGRVGGLFALPSDMEPAALIVLSHVLEHVRDAGAAVDGLRSIAGPAAQVYAEVPDASRYADFLVAPFLDFNTEHINHFSVTTLRRLFASRGWRIVAYGAKAIASSPTTRYPCVWVLAELAPIGEAIEEVPPDPSLRMALSRYVTASHTLLTLVIKRCEELGIASKQIIVWGTGQTTAILLAETPLGSARIRAFTDSNPMHYGRTISGVPVVPPDALRSMAKTPIVIGSLLHGDEIADAIYARGLRNPIIRLDPGSP
jgi:SAM-dependent methyltransferase